MDWWKRWEYAFALAFGDPYVKGDGFSNEPVFKVPLEGDPVNLTAVSVCPDGRIWFGSSGPTALNAMVAVWNGSGFHTFDARSLGLGERAVEDLVCLPDGRLVIAGHTRSHSARYAARARDGKDWHFLYREYILIRKWNRVPPSAIRTLGKLTSLSAILRRP